MQFDNAFSVAAPIDEVFRTMVDVERWAPCLPGVRVVARTGENAYRVALRVAVGPLSMTYTGDVALLERDDAGHRALVSAEGRDPRGTGTARATVEFHLTQEGDGTRARMRSEVAIGGRASGLPPGMLGGMSDRMIGTFADNLSALLARSPAEPV
ncbi:MAG: SRPBCC family protein, partial [Actinobacteria bacterium]|nr:SRPBCC family protein [Actinomycetota bacterium]